MTCPIRSIILAVVSVGLISAAGAQVPDNTALPLPENYFPTLKTILVGAMQLSPQMLAQNSAEAVAEGNRIVARSGQLPTVGGYFNYYPYERDTRIGRSEPLRSERLLYGINVVQPVYHWNILRNNSRIGQLQLEIARNQTAEAYRLMVQEIRRQFLQLIVIKAGVQQARFNERIARDSQKTAQSNVDAQTLAPGSMFDYNVALDRAVLAADRAQDDYDSRRRLLGKLCGTPPLTDDQVPNAIPEIDFKPAPLKSMLADVTGKKEMESYGLESLRYQSEIERMNYHNAKVRLRPQLNTVVGLSQDQQSYTADVGQKYGVQQLYAGIQISWSIFDGFATRGSKASSLARRRQIERSIETASADLQDEAQTELRQVEFSSRDLELANRMLRTSQSSVAIRKDDIKRGLASESDLNPTLYNFYSAQIDAYSARADFLMKIVAFLSTIHADPALANLPRKNQ